MGMVVLLVEGGEVSVSATLSEALARLGVSRLELLREANTTAIVLEGWAFEPGSANGIVSTLAPGLEVRTLLPLMHIVVGDAGDGAGVEHRK
jgi:hypothetical protein